MEQKIHNKKHSETGPNKESQRQVIFVGNNLSPVSIRDESSLKQQERGETILLTLPQLPLLNDLGLKKFLVSVKTILAFVPDVVLVVSHVRLLQPHGLCIPPGFSVHEILQVRVLEWVVISFSWGSS